jgi:hypothetical protein
MHVLKAMSAPMVHMPTQEFHSKNYSVGYYKNTNHIGLRRKHGGKKETITFGKHSGMTEKTLRGFADDCLKQLDHGDTEAAVQDWVNRLVKPVGD